MSTPVTVLTALIRDLRAETAQLDPILASLSDSDWGRPTPAQGWTITDQVTHLAYFDETTLLSLTDPERFRMEADALMARGADFPDLVAADQRQVPRPDLLNWFRRAREALLAGYAAVDPTSRLPWYGPSMGPASSITARLMETWAHGQDIADTVGVVRPATGRLRHIAHLGVRTTAFSFALNNRPAPIDPIRVELTGPDGDHWTWGPVDASDRVVGPALDFCLVVTQRRHLTDTALEVSGATATEWLSIAQAFAGSPGPGRPPADHAEEVR